MGSRKTFSKHSSFVESDHGIHGCADISFSTQFFAQMVEKQE